MFLVNYTAVVPTQRVIKLKITRTPVEWI